MLWYLCHIGVWEPLRSVTPWELLMHGMGIERTHPGVWSADVVAFLASFGYGASLVAALYLLARGYRAPDAWTGEKELKIRALLQQYGANDSLSYFATRRDKQVIFSPDQRAAITYRRWVRCVWRRATRWVTRIRGMPRLSSGCCRRVVTVGFLRR